MLWRRIHKETPRKNLKKSANTATPVAPNSRVFVFRARFFVFDRTVAASVGRSTLASAVTTRYRSLGTRRLIRGGWSVGGTRDLALIGVFDQVIGTKAVIDKAVLLSVNHGAFFSPGSGFFFTSFPIHFGLAFPFGGHATMFHLRGSSVFVDAPITDNTIHVLLTDHGVHVFNVCPFAVGFPIAILVFEIGVVRKEFDGISIGKTPDSFERVLHQDIAITSVVTVK